MEQTVPVKKTFTELTEFVLNVQLEQDSDYKQAHAFLVIRMKSNGIQFVFVKLISTSLTVLVVNVQMEQPTTKTNKFVTVCVPDSTKFGMEKYVYVPKDLIVSTEYVPGVQLVLCITETPLFAKIFVNWMKFWMVWPVFVLQDLTELTEHVENVKWEQLTIKALKFVKVFARAIKFTVP